MKLGKYNIKTPYIKDGIAYGSVYKTKQKKHNLYILQEQANGVIWVISYPHGESCRTLNDCNGKNGVDIWKEKARLATVEEIKSL